MITRVASVPLQTIWRWPVRDVSAWLKVGCTLQGMSTAPIPALAPVIRTVLPRNLDALKMDMDERGRTKAGFPPIDKTVAEPQRALLGQVNSLQPPCLNLAWLTTTNDDGRRCWSG